MDRLKKGSPHIVIRKLMWGDPSMSGWHMWRGTCTSCLNQWQFWFFGASLGYGLEHLRICTARKGK